MIRRCYLRFAGPVVAKEMSGITSEKGLTNDVTKKQTPEVEPIVAVSGQKLQTTSSPFDSHVIDSRPDASEAPHLLIQESNKSSISAKKIRNFTAMLAVGVGCVATVYYLLSKQVADHFEEEAKMLRKMEEDASRVRKHSPLPQFVAPSSFAMLHNKVIEEEKLKELGLAKHQQSKTTPVLHQELLLRCKLRWNKMVQDGQDSVNVLILQYNNYRDERMKAVMLGALELDGLKVISMEQDNN